MKERVLILSGHYPASHWQSQTNHKIFADLLGFDYRHASHCTFAKDPYIHKINWIAEYIREYDYVFWIDDDSYFLDFTSDVAETLMKCNTGFFLGGRDEEPGVPPPPINACFFGLRKGEQSAKILAHAASLSDSDVLDAWDETDGHAYGGDQDRLWLAIKSAGARPAIGGVGFVQDQSLNGRYQDLTAEPSKSVPRPKILHLTGRSNRKWKKLRSAMSITGSGNGMVLAALVKDFPSLGRGQHRIIASRLADDPKLHPIARLLPKKLMLRLGGK